MDTVLFHRLDVGPGDPVDAALGEQRLGEQVAGHDVAAPLQVHPAHAEVAELVLVGDPDDLRLVPHLAGPQLELQIDRILEGRALAGAGAVPDADQEALPLTAAHPCHRLIQSGGRGNGMLRGAYRQAVAVRAESLGPVEPQPRAGGVDQIVVRHRPGAARYPLDRHVRARVAPVPFGMDRARPGLDELDAVPLVDRRQGERHLAWLHQADTDPDVGRYPVVSVARGNHGDGVVPAQPLPGERRRGVPGDARTEDDDAAHRRSPISCFIPAASCLVGGGVRDQQPASPKPSGRSSRGGGHPS